MRRYVVSPLLVVMTLSAIAACNAGSGTGIGVDGQDGSDPAPEVPDSISPADNPFGDPAPDQVIPEGDQKDAPIVPDGTTADGCVPYCDGRACGDDQCGGTCGTCGAGKSCTALGHCIAKPGCDEVTSVGCCDGETLWYCAAGEVASQDCSATPKCGWSAVQGFACGTDGFAAPGGSYPFNCPWHCNPKCAGRQCGEDGCGGVCGTCGVGTICTSLGHCVAAPDCTAVSKIGCCDGPTLWYCNGEQVVSKDCSDTPQCGWSATSKGYACGTDGTAEPDGAWAIDCPWTCHPQCQPQECGNDGCGGVCGEPDCDGKECGPNGCWGSCGVCAGDQSCWLGRCGAAACDGKTCGSDGLGGSCGKCPDGFACSDAGQCIYGCSPDCTGRACGSDGCGNTCGKCTKGSYCDDATGTCSSTCKPKFTGVGQCGYDGCGHEWGSCPVGVLCTIAGACGSTCFHCPAGPSCLSQGFETGNLADWAVHGAADVVQEMGAAKPTGGNYMARIPNLPFNSQITFQSCVPAGTTTLRFAWKFYSEEFVEWCGSSSWSQDRFEVKVAVGDGIWKSVFLREIDNLCKKGENGCVNCGSDYVGLTPSDVQFDQGDTYMTGWQVATVDLTAILGGKQSVVLVDFAVANSPNDLSYESLVLLDEVEFLPKCTPDCGTAECGSDGCGGLCGTCPNAECVQGKCGECVPSCPSDAQCGGDGCGGTCGTCASDLVCQSGECVNPANPECPSVCKTDADCPKPAIGSGSLTCALPGGFCFDAGGSCDGDGACCPDGQVCFDLMSLLFGGMPSTPSSMPVCSCVTQDDCLSTKTCTPLTDLCAQPLLGNMFCPSGVPSPSAPKNLCFEIDDLLSNVDSGQPVSP